MFSQLVYSLISGVYSDEPYGLQFFSDDFQCCLRWFTVKSQIVTFLSLMVYHVVTDGLYRCPRWFFMSSRMVDILVQYLTVLSQAAYTVVSDGLSGCVSDDSQCCFK